MKRHVVIIVIFTILVLIIFSRSSSSLQAGRFATTKRKHNLSVGQLQYYKNHHEYVITEMSMFNKFRRRSSSNVRRKIDGDKEEEEEEKRSIPTGPNPLHNK